MFCVEKKWKNMNIHCSSRFSSREPSNWPSIDVSAVKMLKISFGIKSNVFHRVSDFGSYLWLNTRAVTNRACVKFEIFWRFTQTGNNNSTKTLLPVRRRARTRAREHKRERARPSHSVTCSTCARIGVRTRWRQRGVKSDRKNKTGNCR